MDIASQVQIINQILLAGEPTNISIDSYSGFTGYKPQYIIDAMNEAFGFGNWGFEEQSNEIAEGDKAVLIVSQVRVFLKDCAFQPTGWGQARITKGDIGDARKGAQTDAIKKALSYFSIGNRAYQGLLPKEEGQQNGHNPQVSSKPVGTSPSRQNSNGNAPKPSEVDEARAFVGKVYAFKQEDAEKRWRSYIVHVLGSSKADPDLSSADLSKLRGFAIEEEKRQKAKAANNGQAA